MRRGESLIFEETVSQSSVTTLHSPQQYTRAPVLPHPNTWYDPHDTPSSIYRAMDSAISEKLSDLLSYPEPPPQQAQSTGSDLTKSVSLKPHFPPNEEQTETPRGHPGSDFPACKS